MSARHSALALVLLVLLLSTGCRTAEPTATSVPVTATRIAVAATNTLPLPTNTPLSPRVTTRPPVPTQTPVSPTVTAVPSTRTQTPVPPTGTTSASAPIEIEEIRFQSDRAKLVGDLQIPVAEGRHPAIIMVHGAGQSDRTDWGKYRPLMERFLRAGYAVFSWDKPGTGESSGKLSYASEVLSERAAILLVAIGLLKEHPGIDPDRIGLWGISQAGYVMPLALTMTDDVAFMIVVSGPGMNSYGQGAYLVGQLAFCAGASEEEARLIEQQTMKAETATNYQEYLESIVPLREHPLLTEPRFRPDIVPEDEWEPEDRSRLSFFDPIEVIEQTTIPVLAFFGERDRQVDPFQGALAYERALQKAGNPYSHVELVPGTDHNIVLSEAGCLTEQGTRSRAEWLKYAPEYLDLLERWLVQLSILTASE